jgi:ankyrin repeat protein
MSTWAEYKATRRSEPDLFDYARTGDLRGLATLLSQDQNLDLNAKNHRGYSALMLAVYNGENVFCEALLRSGADVDSVDYMGNSVLMASGFKGNTHIASLLLDFGADVTLKNKANMNARDWASMFGRDEVVQLLDSRTQTGGRNSRLLSVMRFIKLSVIMLLSKKHKNSPSPQQ